MNWNTETKSFETNTVEKIFLLNEFLPKEESNSTSFRSASAFRDCFPPIHSLAQFAMLGFDPKTPDQILEREQAIRYCANNTHLASKDSSIDSMLKELRHIISSQILCHVSELSDGRCIEERKTPKQAELHVSLDPKLFRRGLTLETIRSAFHTIIPYPFEVCELLAQLCCEFELVPEKSETTPGVLELCLEYVVRKLSWSNRPCDGFHTGFDFVFDSHWGSEVLFADIREHFKLVGVQLGFPRKKRRFGRDILTAKQQPFENGFPNDYLTDLFHDDDDLQKYASLMQGVAFLGGSGDDMLYELMPSGWKEREAKLIIRNLPTPNDFSRFGSAAAYADYLLAKARFILESNITSEQVRLSLVETDLLMHMSFELSDTKNRAELFSDPFAAQCGEEE